MEQEKISVLIVDDSALMRNLIGKIIESAEDLEVNGKAMNGLFALQKIPKGNPDIIVLDLEMPEMNGIEFLKERQKQGLDIPVIILSSIAKKGAKITMEALALGASDFIMKPSGSESEDIHTIGNHLIELIRAYGSKYRAKKGKMTKKPDKNQPVVAPLKVEQKRDLSYQEAPKKIITEKITPLRSPGSVEIIAIGISTGGPNALREVFSQIKEDLRLPIVVVQHMPAGFTEEFAKSLDRICPLEVKEAQEGDLIKPGRILIAPGDYHIEVEKKPLASVIHLSTKPPVNGHRPSVDVLFASVAKEYGNKSIAVIMTGMGRDGAQEIGSIYREGGITIGQDEASCVVYGMPKVASENGYLQYVVSLNKMAETINKLSQEYRN